MLVNVFGRSKKNAIQHLLVTLNTFNNYFNTASIVFVIYIYVLLYRYCYYCYCYFLFFFVFIVVVEYIYERKRS